MINVYVIVQLLRIKVSNGTVTETYRLIYFLIHERIGMIAIKKTIAFN